MLSIIAQKMCPDDRKVWSRDLERGGERATLQKLMDWMTVEMKSRIRATAPIRTGSSSQRLVYHLTADSDRDNKPPWCKCWLCHNSEHWPDQCHKFAGLSIDDRIKTAIRNHACFGCLKKASREHRLENRSRKQRCTKTGNGEQCKFFHHPLLHKKPEVKASISSVTDSQEALLPVITADIG